MDEWWYEGPYEWLYDVVEGLVYLKCPDKFDFESHENRMKRIEKLPIENLMCFI